MSGSGMKDLVRMAKELTGLPSRVSVSIEADCFRVTLADGRSQQVEAWRERDQWVFSSTVVSRKRLNELSWSELAELVWPRNLRTPLVGFQLDERGRLVGRAETPAATLDASELAAYLVVLARECDRLEMVLTGRDLR